MIPKKHEINTKKLVSALESVGLTSVIILVVWFTVILLKFDDKVWKFCIIFRLIFASVVPRQPSRTYERILFLFVVMLGFIYSNDIYSSLINLGIDNLVEQKYETFKDIEDSGLTPYSLDWRTMKKFSNIIEPELHWMRENLDVIPPFQCITTTREYHRCCVMLNIPHLWQQYQLIKSVSFAKLIFWTEDMSFIFRQGLPGREKMSQVIDRCDETGLLKKWYGNTTGSWGHQIDADDNTQLKAELLNNQLRKQLIVVVVFGHGLATLVFIGELLTHRLTKHFKSRSGINLWSVFKRRNK